MGAHDYRECSNKGLCDRSSGTCECFPGYEGSACQRASCPSSSNGVCSGHGTCKTIQELSLEDHGNVYRLWDEDVTMGCDCDAGYSGPDCSSRVCKYGADPLYYDDFQNVRFANFTLDFYMETTDDIAYGNYSIIFTDRHGEDWQTDPIDINAPCSVIQDRLESLPNNVIPTGSVLCSRSQEAQHLVAGGGNNGQSTPTGIDIDNPLTTTDGTDGTDGLDGFIVAENGIIYDSTMLIIARYIIAFPGNPGEIPPLRVNKYLDGARPTLFTTESTTSTLGWHIYPNGYIGEDTDYVNDECEGVLVTIGTGTYQSYLEVSTEQTKLLKACLGDSNGDATDNVDVQDWDWGTWTNPHLIKLVDTTQDAYVEYLRADGSSYKLRVTQEDHNTVDPNMRHEYFVDTAGADYPVTNLCNNGKNYLHTKAGEIFDWYTVSGNTDEHDLNVGTDDANGYLGQWGWCKALNPPGFYAVIYYDDCSAAGITDKTGGTSADNTCSNTNPWRVITNAGFHYGNGADGATTKFHVFTTKGTMQQVSQFAAVHTIRDDMPYTDRLASYHSNIVYMHNTTYDKNSPGGTDRDLPADAKDYGLSGQVDCETTSSVLGAGSGKNGALDCLDYGDKVMFLNLGTHTFAADSNCDTSAGIASSMAGVSYSEADRLSCNYKPTMASFLSNPPAPNMYTVKKISHDPLSTDASVYMSDNAAGISEDRNEYYRKTESFSSYRRRILLDYGMNANYQFVGTSGTAVDADGGQSSTGNNDEAMLNNDATAYKFYPPTLATTGTTGYNYVAECSNRGICDGETGLCNCFAGYAGDNCGLVSSLVK